MKLKELTYLAGYQFPEYNREEVKKNTKEAPEWLHFGAGNIFRAFPAAVLQAALEQGIYDKGVIVCEGFDYEIIEKAYRPFDNLSLLVLLKADGSMEKKVIGSITESLTLDKERKADRQRLYDIFCDPGLKMVSFTITEKGYTARTETGGDLMEEITGLLYQRFLSGAAPIAMVSMDNCAHNGDILKKGVMAYVKQWEQQGKVKPDFAKYINTSGKVSFPWTMIDKITPRPDEEVSKMLAADGLEESEIIITSKQSYVAGFVNAEELEYLVIEDDFPNGRPPLEAGGVIFTDRNTVDKVEKMKVGACLNPLHTALAIYGCLLGYTRICEEMKDKELVDLITRMAYEEAIPTVQSPGIMDPEEFTGQVLKKRLPNPFMPDAPQRIATDTSQKIPVRFGETLKIYHREGKDLNELTLIPLVLAGYLRYLMGIDDQGNPFTPSPDPMLAELMGYMKGCTLGMEVNEAKVKEILRPILEKTEVFGVDLYQYGLADKICGMFSELTAGPEAVRNTLQKYV